MKQIEIVLMPLNQWGKRSEVGKHVKPLTRAEIVNAIADAVGKGFETVYVYARQPSKAVNDWVQWENGYVKSRITWIPGGLSGRGGYLFALDPVTAAFYETERMESEIS